ncbi:MULTISPECIES: hypothetical protein [unclassified Luteococcus]|uniref:hypothetical protein n=1 Tax=unclassified Luteococcus TaxID=2639923 RepID=UPI00313ABBB8
MHKYVINEDVINPRDKGSLAVEVQADSWKEEGTFTVFLDSDGKQVYAIPTSKVRTVRMLDSNN